MRWYSGVLSACNRLGIGEADVGGVEIISDGGKGAEAEGGRRAFDGPFGGSDSAGGEELLAGEGGHGGQGHEDEGAVEEGDDLGVGGTAVGAEGFEAKLHGEVEFDEVSVAPEAMDFGEATGELEGMGLAVDGDLGGGGLILGPLGDAKVQRKGGGVGGAEVDPDGVRLGVAGLLFQFEVGGLGDPFEDGGEVEADPDGRVAGRRVSVWAEKVGVDAVVGGELGEGAGAAGSAVGGVDAAAALL